VIATESIGALGGDDFDIVLAEMACPHGSDAVRDVPASRRVQAEERIAESKYAQDRDRF